MGDVGSRTAELLESYGISAASLEEIACGDISWDLVGADLLLFDDETGGHHHVARLTAAQVDELINAWQFESREMGQERPMASCTWKSILGP